MSKWAGTLSTTEPYNHLGLLKVRQGNENSEIFEFNIIENGLPYDLSGYRVFFCTHFDPYISVEKNAEIIDAKKGVIRFVMDDDCMQKTGQQEGYFEIYKEDVFLDATQNFTYTIQTSIIKQLMDGESYIQRLEELLEKLKEAMEKSQEEVEKWLEENRQKIDGLMQEMEEFFEHKQIEFNEWFDGIRDILESIDPGGVLLNEIVTARNSENYGIFTSLDDRLENSENVLVKLDPIEAVITVNHKLGCYPLVIVTSWTDGFGVTGLGTKTAFGSIPETIPTIICYPDKNNVIVKVPKHWKLNNPVVTNKKQNSYLLVSGNNSLRIKLIGGNS